MANDEGMNVLQQKNPVPVGFNGRFELPGGYVVELAELKEEGKKVFLSRPSIFGYI